MIRGEDEIDLRVRLDSRPSDTGRLKIRRGWIGVKTIDLPPSLREHFGAPPESGMMVSLVRQGSPAEAAGFALGDVVYEVNGEPARTGKQFATRIRRGGVGNRMEFTIARAGSEIVLEAEIVTPPHPVGH